MHRMIYLYRFLLLLVIAISVFPLNLYSQCSPVAYYPFTGNANDYSGNGNHGQLAGEYMHPQPAKDRFGNYTSAFSFGGMNNKNWIEIPNSPSLQLTHSLSVSLWFKQCSFSGMNGFGNLVANGYFILLSKAGDGYAANPGYWCWTHTTGNHELELSFNNKNGNSSSSINFMQSATFNCFDSCEWMHMAVVINYDKWQMYLNSELVQDITIDTADFTSANQENLFIGRMFGSSTIWYPFSGVIDDLAIYNCALTQQEISALYANYSDPLSINNKIIINTININSPSCSNMNDGMVEISASNSNSDWLYSIDGGSTFQSSPVFHQLSPGSYSVVIQSTCTTLDTSITLELLNYHAINSITLCNGMNYQLPGGTVTNIAGIYIDSLLTSLGCDSIITTYLAFTQDTTIYMDTTICSGMNYILPSGSLAEQTGLYSDTLTSASGCDSIIVTNLSHFNPLELSIINNPVSCFGRKDGSLIFTAINGYPPYQFTLGNKNNQTGSFTNLAGGDYIYKAEDSKGCITEGSVIISEPEEVLVTIHPDQITADLYNSIQVNANSNYVNAEFHWDPETNLSCTSCQNPECTVMENIVYTVTASVLIDQHYCFGKAELPVKVQPVIYLPNTFSPNSDGINDCFQLSSFNAMLNNFSITIFNRWGEKIFSSGNSAFKWDGNYHGKKENGNYIYIIKYTFNNSEQIKTGSINITD